MTHNEERFKMCVSACHFSDVILYIHFYVNGYNKVLALVRVKSSLETFIACIIAGDQGHE